MTPWERDGVSKATWYRRRRAGKKGSPEDGIWKRRHDEVVAELYLVKNELRQAKEAIAKLEGLTRPTVRSRITEPLVKAVAWNAKSD